MKVYSLIIGVFQGLLAVGALYLIQSIVQAFRPEWHLPFSPWWGLITCLPGIGFAVFASREEL